MHSQKPSLFWHRQYIHRMRLVLPRPRKPKLPRRKTDLEVVCNGGRAVENKAKRWVTQLRGREFYNMRKTAFICHCTHTHVIMFNIVWWLLYCARRTRLILPLDMTHNTVCKLYIRDPQLFLWNWLSLFYWHTQTPCCKLFFYCCSIQFSAKVMVACDESNANGKTFVKMGAYGRTLRSNNNSDFGSVCWTCFLNFKPWNYIWGTSCSLRLKLKKVNGTLTIFRCLWCSELK